MASRGLINLAQATEAALIIAAQAKDQASLRGAGEAPPRLGPGPAAEDVPKPR